jgi:hypothetical protein
MQFTTPLSPEAIQAGISKATEYLVGQPVPGRVETIEDPDAKNAGTPE